MQSRTGALLIGLFCSAVVLAVGIGLEQRLTAESVPTSPRTKYLIDTKFGTVECDRVGRSECGVSATLCTDLRTYVCLTDVRFEERP